MLDLPELFCPIMRLILLNGPIFWRLLPKLLKFEIPIPSMNVDDVLSLLMAKSVFS